MSPHTTAVGSRRVPPSTAAAWLLLVLAPLAAAGCGSFTARGDNAEGVRLFQQSNYPGAMQQFQQAIYADPNNADAYYNLAAVYHRLGKQQGQRPTLDQAEQLYNQCLIRDPGHRDAYRGLAVLLVEENRSSDAFRLMQNWVAKQPTSADARIELARLNGEFGNNKAAEENLASALAIDPDNARAWAALGKVREDVGDRAQALSNYQRSLQLNRFQPDVASRVAALQISGGVAAPTMATAAPPPDNDDYVRTVTRDSLPRR